MNHSQAGVGFTRALNLAGVGREGLERPLTGDSAAARNDRNGASQTLGLECLCPLSVVSRLKPVFRV
jgi:hypothetical protein